MARPSEYSDEIAVEICTRLSDGEPLRTILNTKGMPGRSTVYEWLHTHPKFQATYARARQDAGDVWAERAVAMAMTADPVTAAAVRVKYDAIRWYASKLAPKVYGDKIAHTGGDGGPITLTVNTGVKRGDAFDRD